MAYTIHVDKDADGTITETNYGTSTTEASYIEIKDRADITSSAYPISDNLNGAMVQVANVIGKTNQLPSPTKTITENISDVNSKIDTVKTLTPTSTTNCLSNTSVTVNKCGHMVNIWGTVWVDDKTKDCVITFGENIGKSNNILMVATNYDSLDLYNYQTDIRGKISNNTLTFEKQPFKYSYILFNATIIV